MELEEVGRMTCWLLTGEMLVRPYEKQEVQFQVWEKAEASKAGTVTFRVQCPAVQASWS